MRRDEWVRGLLLCALAACNQGSGKEATGASTSAPAATASGAGPTTTAAVAAAAPPDAKPVIGAGRTAVPTLAEWGTQLKEITVKGSSALNCETKAVREYLRVSCRGKNDSGGTPTAVKVTKGGREALTFASGGITSLVVPFVEGIDLEAQFSWTDKSHKLAVKWPRGSKQPVVFGVFEGAKSPLDGTAEGDMKKLCECHKKVTKEATCDGMLGGADADCDRTYGGSCEMLLACSRGEPAAFPRCLPGSVNFGAMGRCAPQCGPGKAACAAGKQCVSDMASSPVCLDM